MSGIIEKTHDLNAEILSSDTYKEYSRALDAVSGDDALLLKIKDFKEVQAKYNSEGQITFDKEKHLSKLYYDLAMNEKAKEFLECEKRFLGLILNVQDTLWADCKIKLNF